MAVVDSGSWFGKYQNQNIIVTLDDGKLVILQLNTSLGKLEALQMLNAEEGAIGLGAEVTVNSQGRRICTDGEHFPFLTVDGTGSLACSVLYGYYLFFVPLQSTVSTISGSTIPKPFLLDIAGIGLPGPVLDIAFLTGYSRPTIAMLQEPRPLPLGHCCKVRNTCCVTVLGVDVTRGSVVVMWQQDLLPHDSCRLLSVRLPVTGALVLVLSMNAVIAVSQDAVAGVGVNGFATTSVAEHIRLQPWPLSVGVELDTVRAADVGGGHIAMALKDGQLLLLQVHCASESSLKSLRFEPQVLASTVRASCFCVSSTSDKQLYWFLGSYSSDALLLSVEATSLPESARQAVVSQLSTPFATPGLKRRRASRGGVGTPVELSVQMQLLSEYSLEIEKEEVLLYGAKLSAIGSYASSPALGFQLQVADSIPVLGPILDGTFSDADDFMGVGDKLNWEKSNRLPSTSASSSVVPSRELKGSLVLSVGTETDATLCSVSRGLQLRKIAGRDFPGAQTVESVASPGSSSTLLFLTQNNKTRVLEVAEKGGSEVGVTEVGTAEGAFADSVATIAAGQLGTCDLVAQVFRAGVRVLRPASSGRWEALQDVLIEEERDMGGLGGEEGETFVSADVAGGWVAALSSEGRLYVLRLDGEDLMLHCCTGSAEEPSVLQEVGANGVAYASLFIGVLDASPPSDTIAKSFSSESFASPEARVRAEEEFLYGCSEPIVRDENADGVMAPLEVGDPPAASESGRKRAYGSEDDSTTAPPRTAPTPPPVTANLVLCTVLGEIVVLRLPELVVVCSIQGLATLPPDLPVIPTRKPNAKPSLARLRELRLVRLSKADAPLSMSRLCLVLVTSAEDVAVYVGTETTASHRLLSFSKLDHGLVGRRRRIIRARSASFGSELGRREAGRLLSAIEDFGGRKVLIIAGPRPLILINDDGLPALLPLGLPELPYCSDSGSFVFCPLKCASVFGIASLWRDTSDGAKGVRLGTLALYQEVPGLKTYVGGTVSVRQTSVGCTVHKCVELLPKTNDKTQQALLRRKTFVLACSEETRREFPKELRTEAEREEDRSVYDRFFPEMNSFSKPDEGVGPAPAVVERSYKVSVVQSGCVVDSYVLPPNEVAVEIEPLYLNVSADADAEEKSGAKDGKRVFVAVSTTICDQHGEDCQGEGRLLLLSLDYAIYETDSGASSGSNSAKSASSADLSDLKPMADLESLPTTTDNSQPQKSESLAQAQFLDAIQPKLRLVCSCPGPATVVKQLGEFILSTVGPTVYLYRLDSATMELEQIAQFYAQFFVAEVHIIKSYIMLVDACRSVQFLAWRESDCSLTLVAKDFDKCFCMSAAFIMDGTALGIVVGDDDRNLKLLRYNARGGGDGRGFQLACVADMHVGCSISILLPHRLLSDPPFSSGLSVSAASVVNADGTIRKPPPPPPPPRHASRPFGARLDKTSALRSALLVGTVEGSLGLVVPVEERTYRRLALLQQIMCSSVSTPLSLNPREFRILKAKRIVLDRKRGVLDGNLLYLFATLEPALQQELTGAMGTTVDVVMDNLLEIDLLNSFF